jgi:ditrans,polycis-polyprenyl diphosphate synthase
MLEICSSLDIKVVSAYAFAIDNFNRPPEEVDGLMNLAEKALLELCSHGCVVTTALHGAALRTSRRRGVLEEHGIRLNTVGKPHLFPPAVQAALAKAKELTKNNNR